MKILPYKKNSDMVLNQTQGDKATTSRGIDGGTLTAM